MATLPTDTDDDTGPSAHSEHPGDHLTIRRHMSARQQATAQLLLDAAERVLDERSYDDLTLRVVATAAGVTHTTAYTYFSSKAHLVSELFWRRLRRIPHPGQHSGAPLGDRVRAALSEPGLALSDEPRLAQAALAAMVSSDPDARRVRDRVGLDLAERLQEALGDDVDPRVGEVLLLAFSGAMLQAGMGYFGFEGVIDRVSSAAELMGNGQGCAPDG